MCLLLLQENGLAAKSIDIQLKQFMKEKVICVIGNQTQNNTLKQFYFIDLFGNPVPCNSQESFNSTHKESTGNMNTPALKSWNVLFELETDRANEQEIITSTNVILKVLSSRMCTSMLVHL